jgi:hypothetical protein
MCHKTFGGGVLLTEPWYSAFFSLTQQVFQSYGVHHPHSIGDFSSGGAMKSLRAKIVSFAGMVGILLLLWACYPAAEVSYSNPQESTVNQWLIEFKTSEARLQLTMRYRREGDNGFSYSNTGFGVTLDQLTGLTRDQVMSSGANVRFQLKRDAGTFNFEGWFKEGNGSGHFTFSPSSSFAAELARQGFGRPTDEQLLSLAMSDTGQAFINELRAQGYDTSTAEQLVRLGNHGVRLEYLQGLKSLGYSVKTTELVVRMKDHGVSLSFIRELAGLGYSNLSPEELVRTKDHGVSAKYISEFITAGYNRSTLDDWITLKDHGVSTGFVTELKNLGYERLPLEDLRRMKDHGVSAAFIKELRDLGYSNTSVEQLVRLKDHGVSASYIKRMKERGYSELPLDEYIRLRDRGERED